MKYYDSEVGYDVWRLGYNVVASTCVDHVSYTHAPALEVLDKTSGAIYSAQILCTLERVVDNLLNWRV